MVGRWTVRFPDFKFQNSAGAHGTTDVFVRLSIEPAAAGFTAEFSESRGGM